MVSSTNSENDREKDEKEEDEARKIPHYDIVNDQEEEEDERKKPENQYVTSIDVLPPSRQSSVKCQPVLALPERSIKLPANHDLHNVSHYLRTSFSEVFAEPNDQYGSLDFVWEYSNKIFELSRFYVYKVLSLIFGFLIAAILGFLFALFAFLNIWIARPSLILLKKIANQFLIFWPIFLTYVVRPSFYAVGAIFSSARLHTSTGNPIKEPWQKDEHII